MKSNGQTISYKCPVCFTRNKDSEIRRQADDLFFCTKCGSRLNERQVKNKLAVCHDLRIANIFIEERNKRFKSDFGPAVEGENPPDVISNDKNGGRIEIEITKYAPNFWSELLSKGSISGNVDPVQWLIDALRIKAKKGYDEGLKNKMILLLEGNVIVDNYFEQNEEHFTDLSFNRAAFQKLGFKEIWYVSLTIKRAFRIY